MSKRFSQFIVKDVVADSEYVNVTGSGVNRRVAWPDFLDNIFDRIVTPFIYPTIAALQEAPLRADEDDPVYVRVEETEYRLYKITNTAPGASDIVLDNGNTATAQTEYRDIGFVVGPDTSSIGALATYDNETGTLLAEGPTPSTVGVNLIEFPDSSSDGFLRKKNDNTLELLTGDMLKDFLNLENVDNTSDLNKPISTATQAALDLKASITYVDAADDDLQDQINDRVQSVATIADLRALTGLSAGQKINVAGYYAGSTEGGGSFTVGSSVLLVDNGVDVFVTSDGMRVHRDDIGYYTHAMGGVRGDNSTDDTEALQNLIDVVSAKGGGIIQMGSNSDYLVSDSVCVRSNICMTWPGKGFLKATSTTSLGAILVAYSGTANVLTENVTLMFPRVDGNNLGYPGGLNDGENGIAATDTHGMRVYGGHVKNCRRGTFSADGAGGKGCQFEDGVSDIVVQGVFIEDCTVGFETGGVVDVVGPPYEYRSGPAVIYRDMQVRNCERLMVLNQQFDGTPTDPSVVSCLVDGVQAYNCGREVPVGTELNFGAIIFDRYCNARVRNVTLTNDPSYGTINAVVRCYRGHYNDFEITFHGECEFLTNNTTTLSSLGTFSKNVFDITHYGTCNQYAMGGPSGESAASAENTYLIKTDVVTLGLIQPAWQISGLWCEFVSSDKVTKISGPANFIGSPLVFNNDYPTASHGLAGTVKFNGMTVSFGTGVQVFDSTDDTEFRKGGVGKLRIKSTGPAMEGLQTYADNAAATAGGLSAGDLYRTATGQLMVRY